MQPPRLLAPCVLIATTALPLTTVSAQDGGRYQEEDGILVVEIESTPTVGDWVVETVPSGYTFQSFHRWNGPNLFGTPGVGILPYRLEVHTAGNYLFRLRNYHDHPDPSLENDLWARMDGGTWFKVFSNTGSSSVGVWNWFSRFDVAGQPQAAWFLDQGQHRLELSGRSFGFRIDRFHLHLAGHPDATNAQRPESVAVLGSVFCPPTHNSSGQRAALVVLGSSFAVNGDVTLAASSLPLDQFGYFLLGANAGTGVMPPGSSGILCLTAPGIGRFNQQIRNSGSPGAFSIVVDTLNLPTNPSSIVAGQTWNFQGWFRDTGTTSNFTNAIGVIFQ